MKLGEGSAPRRRGDLDRGPVARPRPRRHRPAPKGRIIELFGPESSGKTTIALARGRECPAERWRGRVHRRRARARPLLVQAARRQHRVPARQPAFRQRRGGAPDRRDARAFRRGRHHRGRLGRRARPQGRNRRGHRRQPRRPPGPAHEPGSPQADRPRLEVEVRPDLHQPDPREDRRDVRLARDDARRPGLEVLQFGPHRCAPDRAGEGRGGDRRLPREGQGGQEQGRPAVPGLRVRHHVQTTGSRTKGI